MKELTKPLTLTRKETSQIKAGKRDASLLAELRAFAKQAGIDVDNASLEELCQAYLIGYRQTIEEAHTKNIENMRRAEKSRDMETFNSLYVKPSVTDEPKPPAEPPPGTITASPAALMELLERIEKERQQALDRARALDANVLSDSEQIAKDWQNGTKA